MLEGAIETDAGFAKLFGITTVAKPSSNSAEYPYTLSLLAEKVTGEKGAYWSKAQLYIDRIRNEKNVDIKRSDNRYHSATKTGRKASSLVHKYSDHLFELIQRMEKREDYELYL